MMLLGTNVVSVLGSSDLIKIQLTNCIQALGVIARY